MRTVVLLLSFVFLAAAQPAPVEVSVVQPARKTLVRVIEQPSSIQADEETSLHARVPGYLESVQADIGQKVKKGDVLAELSTPELLAEGKEKAAQVRRAEAEIEQARRGLVSAEANVGAIRTLGEEAKAGVLRTEANCRRWALEVQRIASLVERGILDAQTRDETFNQVAAANAAHAEAQARIASAHEQVKKACADRDRAAADVDAALARAEVARAESARVEALLGYAKIVAPYDGIVTRRRVNTGDFVQPAALKGDALFTVARLDRVRLVVPVPEADALLVTEGAAVKFTLPALKETRTGKVARSSWSLDPVARTLRVEIDLPNADGRLRPGLFASVQIVGELPVAWTLPASAVTKQGDGMVCFVIQGDKAIRTSVQVGASDGKTIEVQRIGPVEPTGKEMIAATTTGLTDGSAVRVK